MKNTLLFITFVLPGFLYGQQELLNRVSATGNYRGDVLLIFQRSQPVTENLNIVGRVGVGMTFLGSDVLPPFPEAKSPAMLGASLYVSKFSVQALYGNSADLGLNFDISRFRLSAGYQNLYNNKIRSGELRSGVEVIIYGEFYAGSCYSDAYGRLFTVSFNTLYDMSGVYRGAQIGVNLYLN